MTSPDACRFPDLAATTAYSRGCRCERCRTARRERARKGYPVIRDKERQRARDYYLRNRDARLEAKREWRQAHVEERAARAKQTRARYKAMTPATVTGSYTEEEDRVISGWTGDVVSLAIALGRDYDSVGWRIQKLRRLGTTLARDQRTQTPPTPSIEEPLKRRVE